MAAAPMTLSFQRQDHKNASNAVKFKRIKPELKQSIQF
jgi:hypothetical protein